jgi:serine/threonine protein kinase
MPGPCPTPEQLAAALRGHQPGGADAELAAHLGDCPACQAQLESLAGGSGWVTARAKAHAASTPTTSASLHQAMRALESRSEVAGPEVLSPVKLDFLQLSDQPGVLGRFGPYEVIAHVASGGMGIVLKARDPALNRIVALKILPPVLAANSLARARFIREARAAAAVVHDHVVPIYAVDEFAGLPYLVMQFVQGRTLSERIRAQGPLRLEEILRIGAQTAAGLAAAHAQGLIHRDVKPGNILLENSVERVKITDFGLARATDDSSLTREGYIAGTPEYMSPEQARNEPVDQRADLFSFGCVLYEMATGVSPFRAEKPLVAMRRVCDEEPPPAHLLIPKIPEWLGQFIGRLMAKTASSRPQTAAKVAAQLEWWLAQSQRSPALPALSIAPRPRDILQNGRRSRMALALVAVAIPVLLAIAWLMRSGILGERRSHSVTPPHEIKSQAGLPQPRPALFFIPAVGETDGQGFASLAEAVDAAKPGAVIEFRFNGPQTTALVRLGEKPLILRAAPGFIPVLTSEQSDSLILRTHSPLVLEGLTLITVQSPGEGAAAGRRGLGRAGVSINDALLLAAHCRFEVDAQVNAAARQAPQSVRLMNANAATFLNCQFFGERGFAISMEWQRVVPPARDGGRFVVQGCVANSKLVTGNRPWMERSHLELYDNTLCGEALFVFPPQAFHPDRSPPPVMVTADNNVFSTDQLLRRARPEFAPLDTLLRWQGSNNVFSVREFCANTAPPATNHSEWLSSGTVKETSSLSAELGLTTRLANLTDRTRAAEAAAFTLTAEERQRLKAQGWTSPKPPGADPQKTGPGQPYHEWRNRPDYAEWLKLVRAHIPQSAASQ